MTTFFTSDTHYSHKNICGPEVSDWSSGFRNFRTIDEMNNAIVDSINTTVGRHDTLYHLGDWSFGGQDQIEEFRSRVNCGDIRLIYGNHDHAIQKYDKYRKLFTWCRDMHTVRINRQRIVLLHYAMRLWDKKHHGAWHLYGHSHGSLPDPNNKSFDIGWDCFRKPLSFDEVKAIMDCKPLGESVDHHTKECAE